MPREILIIIKQLLLIWLKAGFPQNSIFVVFDSYLALGYIKSRCYLPVVTDTTLNTFFCQYQFTERDMHLGIVTPTHRPMFGNGFELQTCISVPMLAHLLPHLDPIYFRLEASYLLSAWRQLSKEPHNYTVLILI